MEGKMTLGKRIQKRRKILGITQSDLARSTQVAVQHISAIEQGKRIPSLPVIIKIAEYLQSSLDYLVLGKQDGSNGITEAILAEPRLHPEVKKPLINLIVKLSKTCPNTD